MVAVGRGNLPESDRLLVAYSGGKDSLATLDLCVRAGKDVEAFFMFFLPGMDYTAFWCDYAERRFDIKVHQVQHWNTSYYLRRAVFCEGRPDCPEVGHNDVEAAVRLRTGINWVGYGYKLVDSPSRRSYMTFMSAWCSCGEKPPKCQCRPRDGICSKLQRFSPIMNWTDRDVFAYLSRRRIQIPDASRKVNGIDLLPSTLAQMREQWPADYQRILRVFPYAEGQADRAAVLARNKNRAPAIRVPGDESRTD